MTDLRDAWLTELRSGRYHQGTARLRQTVDHTDELCCLGVAFEVAIAAGLPVTCHPQPAEAAVTEYVWDDDAGHTAYLSGKLGELLGFGDQENPTAFIWPTPANLPEPRRHDCTSLNDERMPFARIADLVEWGFFDPFEGHVPLHHFGEHGHTLRRGALAIDAPELLPA